MDYLDENTKKNTENQQQQQQEQQKEQSSNSQLGTPQINISNFSTWFKSPQFSDKLLSSVNNINDLEIKEEKDKAFILGISGGSSAGKTLLSQLLKAKLKEIGQNSTKMEHFIPIVKQTDFYHKMPKAPKDVDPESFKQEQLKKINFDIPKAIDWDYMIKCLNFLQNKNPVDMPQYNMEHEMREKKTKKIKQKADIIILEGTLLFQNETIRNMCDLKIFLDTDEDTRLSRRVYKDCCLRNKPLKEVIEKYRKFTKEAFETYTFPSKKYADIVIPNFGGVYSATSVSEEEQSAAGFSTLYNGVLHLVLNLLGNRLSKSNAAIIEESNSGSSREASPKIYKKDSIKTDSVQQIQQ